MRAAPTTGFAAGTLVHPPATISALTHAGAPDMSTTTGSTVATSSTVGTPTSERAPTVDTAAGAFAYTAEAATRYVTVGVAPGDSDLMPPRFCGDQSVEAAEWIRDFLDYVAIRHVPESTAVILLRTRLTGAARRWMDGLPSGITLADIVSKFRHRFGAQQGLRPELLREFWGRRQGPNEPSIEFIETMTCLARRIGIDHDELVRQVTMQGLRPELQRDVALQKPATMEELEDAATVAERNARIAAATPRGPADADATVAQLAELRQMMAAIIERPATTAATAAAAHPTSAVTGIASPESATGGPRGRGSQSRRGRGRGRPWHSGPSPQHTTADGTGTLPLPTTTSTLPNLNNPEATVCRNCGWQHAPGACHATTSVCFECTAPGHFARCCPRRAAATPNQ